MLPRKKEYSLLIIFLTLLGSLALSTANLDINSPGNFSFAQLFSATAQSFIKPVPVSEVSSNDEESNNSPQSQQKSQPQPQSKDAYQKLYEFALSDPKIKEALQSGNQLNPQQQKKIADYMVNDPYFQTDLIKQFLTKPQNKWLKPLSKSSQIKYLKIVATLNQNDLTNTSKMNEVKKQILSHSDLGQAYNEFIESNPKLNPLSANSIVLTSNYL